MDGLLANDGAADSRDLLIGLGALPAEALLSEQELSRKLCVGTRTVRRRVARCELPCPIKMGKRRYWKVGRVLAWLDQLAEQAQRESDRRRRSLSALV